MSFQTALSGLTASTADLNVTGNNIANANTTGFKESRAQFGDLFPISSYGVSSNAIGVGVRLSDVAQQFAQGSIDFTDNSLDLAIAGEGFFVVSDNGEPLYTRAGAFGTDDEGYVVNSAGQRLQVYPPSADGSSFDTGNLADLQLSVGENAPQATSNVTAQFNLPAGAEEPTTTPFDATDSTSYNYTTSVTTYDSLGSAHTTSLYFAKDPAVNTWQVYAQIDGNDVGTATALTYSESGDLLTPADGQITLDTYSPGNGAADMDISLSVADATQYGDSFSVASLTQDGYTTGELTGIEITEEGIVQARYTNGQATPLGQIALARFPNTQGLQQVGDTAWASSYEAGQVIMGTAGSANFGGVQSGALEASNVDLTEQLVKMITAQRNFQANSQVISTEDEITQTILNIR